MSAGSRVSAGSTTRRRSLCRDGVGTARSMRRHRIVRRQLDDPLLGDLAVGHEERDDQHHGESDAHGHQQRGDAARAAHAVRADREDDQEPEQAARHQHLPPQPHELVVTEPGQRAAQPDEHEQEDERLDQERDHLQPAVRVQERQRPRPLPPTEEQRRRHRRHRHHVHVLGQEEQRELQRRVLGVEPTHQLRLRLRQVERRPVGLPHHRDHEHHEARRQQEHVPAARLRLPRCPPSTTTRRRAPHPRSTAPARSHRRSPAPRCATPPATGTASPTPTHPARSRTHRSSCTPAPPAHPPADPPAAAPSARRRSTPRRRTAAPRTPRTPGSSR